MLYYTAKATHLAGILETILLFASIVGFVMYCFDKKAAEIIKNWLGKIEGFFVKLFAPFMKLFSNKWYIDELYEAVFLKPYKKVSDRLWRFWDMKIVDGLPNGAAGLSAAMAKNLKQFQSGYIFQYAFVIIVSMIALISYYILF